MKIVSSWTALVLMLICQSSFAAVIAGWEFDNNGEVYGADEEVVVSATIYNSEYSNKNLNLNKIAGVFLAWDMQTIASYNFSLGSSDGLFSQFKNVKVAPGESYNFVFGTFTPRQATVDEGEYGISFAGLFERGFFKSYFAGPFKFSVVDSLGLDDPIDSVVAVSEPAKLSFLAIGLLMMARRFRRVAA